MISNPGSMDSANERDIRSRHQTADVTNVKKRTSGGVDNKSRPEKRRHLMDTQNQRRERNENLQSRLSQEIPSKQRRNEIDRESQTDLYTRKHGTKHEISNDETKSMHDNTSGSKRLHVINKTLTYHYFLDDFPREYQFVLKNTQSFFL